MALPRAPWGTGGPSAPGGPGRVNVGFLLFLLLVASGIYLATNFIPPYWNYYSMRDRTREAILTTAGPGGKDQEALDMIVGRARELQIPLREEDIRIVRTSDRMTIFYAWEIVVTVFGKPYPLQFRVEETKTVL